MPLKKSPLSQVLENNWSPRTDLNRQPADYKSAALPLSYVGSWLKYHIPLGGSNLPTVLF